MLLFWIVLFAASIAIPWAITSYFIKFYRGAIKPEFRTALNNKMMELLGILVVLVWLAVFAGILVERFIIAGS